MTDHTENTVSNTDLLIPIVTSAVAALGMLIPGYDPDTSTDESVIDGLSACDQGAQSDALSFGLSSATTLDDVIALGVTLSRKTVQGIEYLLATLDHPVAPVVALYRGPVTDYPKKG